MRRSIYFALLLSGVIVFLFLSNSIFVQTKQHNVEMQLSNDEALVYRLKEHIVEQFYKARQDVIFIATYLREDLGRQDLTAFTEQEEYRSTLKNVVPSFLKTNGIYKSIAYIDKNKNVVVAMDIDGFSEWKPAAENSGEDFLGETAKHKAGEVYTWFDGTSLFVCSPVFNDTNTFSGVIVLELAKGQLLNELEPFINNQDMMLVEDTGEYILNSGKHSGKSFSAEYSEALLSSILSSDSGNLEYNGNTLMTYTSVALDDHKWFLVLNTSKAESTSMTAALYRQFVILLAIFSAAVILIVFFWISAYRKAAAAEKLDEQKEQLENFNKELIKKQYIMEEQNAVIEELNTQLEDEIVRHLKQKDILQAILDSLGAGVIMVDEKGNLTFINKAWRDLFSYLDLSNCFDASGGFYINRGPDFDIEQFLRNALFGVKDSRKVFPDLLKLLGNFENQYNVDLEQTEPLDRYLNMYSNPCISNSGQSFGRMFVFRDVSLQKEVDRLKSEVISIVSHELRTPMSSILGFSELLLTRRLSAERCEEYIGIIHSEAGRLTKLVNDFLDIQRMESGKHGFSMEFHPFGQIIEEAMKLFKDIDGKYRMTYEHPAEELPLIFCDRDKMIQVLANLLSNAVKYSPGGGAIRINAEVEKDRLAVSVTDQGLGIPDEVKDKLFTKFFRVDNNDHVKIGGTGLGLAICKEIIRSHGGEIGIETVFGKGSTFYFKIPILETSNMNPTGAKKYEN